MTDLSFQASSAVRFRFGGPAIWVCAALVAATAAGLLLGQAGATDSGAFEPRLLLLLRFMAALKFAGVVAAALLVHWRLTRPASPRLALAYVATVAAMALAPGLIWSLSHVGLAAALFHAGLLGFLVLAWKDKDVLPRRIAR